jgi:gas vesicle protein
MEERRTGTGKSFMLGVLAGGVAGGLAALLYAPKSGKELRKDIGRKKDKIVKDVDKYYEDTRKRVDRMIEEGKRKTDDLIHDVKLKAESLGESAGNIYNQGREFVSDEASKIKGAVKAGVDAFKQERKQLKNH